MTTEANGKTLAAELGARFAAARGSASLRSFARAHGLNHVTVYEFEQGRDNPTLARLERWAELYGVTLTVTVDPAE